jgi:bifunctional DNA-binding transcriptional regulator/antitoxin component of YhaV-PrlF toxin-antitoxin module
MARVKKRRRGYTRISPKHQVTIPTTVLAEAGLAVGDVLRVERDGDRVVLVPAAGLAERRLDAIDETAGALTGVYPPGYLETLRNEWR